MTTLRRVALVVIAGGALLVGVWAQGFPRAFYDDFRPVTDREVDRVLSQRATDLLNLQFKDTALTDDDVLKILRDLPRQMETTGTA